MDLSDPGRIVQQDWTRATSPTSTVGTGAPSPGEAPAGRAVRLGGGDPDDRVEPEPVEVPGRRSGARRAERGGERVARHLGRPATVPVDGDHLFQRGPVGDPGRLAVEYEVDVW